MEKLDFPKNTKYSLDYVKNLENELRIEKEKSERFKALFECEKENSHLLKIEALKNLNTIVNFNNENFDVDEATKELTLRNKEFYEKIIKLSDTIFEC